MCPWTRPDLTPDRPVSEGPIRHSPVVRSRLSWYVTLRALSWRLSVFLRAPLTSGTTYPSLSSRNFRRKVPLRSPKFLNSLHEGPSSSPPRVSSTSELDVRHSRVKSVVSVLSPKVNYERTPSTSASRFGSVRVGSGRDVRRRTWRLGSRVKVEPLRTLTDQTKGVPSLPGLSLSRNGTQGATQSRSRPEFLV